MAFVLKAGRPLQQKGAGILAQAIVGYYYPRASFVLVKDPHLIAAMEKTQRSH